VQPTKCYQDVVRFPPMPTPEEKEAWEVRWGPHLVKLRMGIVDGRPAIIALEMSGGPITSTDLRLPLATLLSEHLELVRREITTADTSPWGSPWKSDHLADVRSSLFEPKKRAGGAPRKYDDEHFEGVAIIYRNALRDGLSPLGEVMRIKRIKKAKAAKWVQRARDLEYLPPTTRGRSKA
jgi:hypothetical protein